MESILTGSLVIQQYRGKTKKFLKSQIRTDEFKCTLDTNSIRMHRFHAWLATISRCNTVDHSHAKVKKLENDVPSSI
jgi:hypothetical protein